MLDFKSAVFNVLALLKLHRPATDSNLQEFDLLRGDFNMDWVEHSTQNFMKELRPGYKQLIHESTTDYGSTLDHVYTNIDYGSTLDHVYTNIDYGSTLDHVYTNIDYGSTLDHVYTNITNELIQYVVTESY